MNKVTIVLGVLAFVVFIAEANGDGQDSGVASGMEVAREGRAHQPMMPNNPPKSSSGRVRRYGGGGGGGGGGGSFGGGGGGGGGGGSRGRGNGRQ